MPREDRYYGYLPPKQHWIDVLLIHYWVAYRTHETYIAMQNKYYGA